jgi:hypothetical protein
MVAEETAPEKQARNYNLKPGGAYGWVGWTTAVLMLAAVMRLVALQDVPPGLAQDEVLNADIVTFIRQGAFALFFREGYGHEPLYHYWSTPFQVLLGDNVLSIRLPAVFLGILLVALTMRWGKRAFGGTAAIGAGAFLAISWWPIVFSRVGLRPIMEPVFLLLFAWFWPRRPWLAGLFLGLSLYTYTGARVLFLWPLLLGLYWFLFRSRLPAEKVSVLGRALPQPLLAAGVTLSVMLLLYAPLAITLRADPTLQQRVQQLEGPLVALREGSLRPILTTSLATLGVFSSTGDPRWTYMLPGRPLFDPLTAVLFYGGLALAAWRFLQPWYAFLLFWLLVGLLPSAITPQAPSTVRMVGAMPAVYLFPGLAVAWLWSLRGRLGSSAAWARWGIPLFTAALFAINLALTINLGFVRWPQALETRLKYQTVLRDMADYLRAQPAQSPVFADGFFRPITADTLRRDMGDDIDGRWVQSGSEVAGAVVLPAEGGGSLYVPEYAAPDVQLMAYAGIDPQPAYRSPQRPSFAVYELPSESGIAMLAQTFDFENLISLVGYEITSPPDGQVLQMLSAWQVAGDLPYDLAIFVHWLDDEGRLISQHDGLDAAPQTLQRGDLIIQRHVLPYPSGMSNPSGSLQIGLYLRENGRRLSLSGGDRQIGDTVEIPLSEEMFFEQP